VPTGVLGASDYQLLVVDDVPDGALATGVLAGVLGVSVVLDEVEPLAELPPLAGSLVLAVVVATGAADDAEDLVRLSVL
jgi:hypothetical protein